MHISLTKPVSYKDTELHTIVLELDTLTGYDIIAVEDELRMTGVNVSAWDYSRNFLITVAAKCAHLPVDVLKSLHVADFSKITNEVLSFLLGADSKTQTLNHSGD